MQVGNPGNLPDSTVENDGTTGYGAVGYSFQIDKYDITTAQYVQFLNAKATNGDPLGLYNTNMSSPVYGGVTFSFGTYGVRAGFANYPMMYVNWYDAIRFANWLNNGQGNGDTESGSYLLLGGTPVPSNANSIMRQTGGTIFLPTENEWYKAAYYNPATNSYFQYGTSSNTAPTAQIPPGGTNSANYDGGVNTLSSVGAYAQTKSPYGAYDMSGDLDQWNEQLFTFPSGSYRGTRGGNFLEGSAVDLASSARFFGTPTFEDTVGFRVVLVPEPSTLVLGVLAALMLGGLWLRFYAPGFLVFFLLFVFWP